LAAYMQYRGAETSPCLNRSRRRSPDARNSGFSSGVVARDADTPHKNAYGISTRPEDTSLLSIRTRLERANNVGKLRRNIFTSHIWFGRSEDAVGKGNDGKCRGRRLKHSRRRCSCLPRTQAYRITHYNAAKLATVLKFCRQLLSDYMHL
jgi:hypothetical protein